MNATIIDGCIYKYKNFFKVQFISLFGFFLFIYYIQTVYWLAGCCCCSLEIGKVVCLFVQVGHKWMDNKDKMESKCQKEEKEVNGMDFW